MIRFSDLSHVDLVSEGMKSLGFIALYRHGDHGGKNKLNVTLM